MTCWEANIEAEPRVKEATNANHQIDLFAQNTFRQDAHAKKKTAARGNARRPQNTS
jgi:hypothetical protein